MLGSEQTNGTEIYYIMYMFPSIYIFPVNIRQIINNNIFSINYLVIIYISISNPIYFNKNILSDEC